MKNLIYLLVAALFSLSAVSCGTYAYSQEVYDNEVIISNDNVSIIITQGTPVYYEGHLHYYIYNGLYWYPFWYENHWYFCSYTRIYPWGYDFHFRPHHSDYRFRPGHHGFRRPDHSHGHYGLPREGRVYHDNPNKGNHNTRRPTINRDHNPRPNNNPGMNNGRRPNVNPGNRVYDGGMRRSQQMGGQRIGGPSQSRPANVGGGRRH